MLAGGRVVRGDRVERATVEATMAAERFDAAIDMICHPADAARYLKWLDESGLIPDPLRDDTEDRLIRDLESIATRD
jgi:hypothetical protein